MKANEKNKKLIIIVSILLLVIGVSFAYFVSRLLLTGDGSNVSTNPSANIRGIEMEVNGSLSFTDTNVYPGHTNVSIIEIIAKGDKEFIPYNLYWEGTNSINTVLNYKVYRLETREEVTSSCKKKSIMIGASRQLSEECTITNIDSLGKEIYSGTINKDDTKVKITNGEFIEASEEGTKNYYYVIIEYPNLEEEQNSDMAGSFTGVIKAEEANIKIIGIKEENGAGEYIDIEKIPSKEDKVLNTDLSTCNNNASISWNEKTNTLQINNIGETGTECSLYFDKKVTASDTILAEITPKDSPTTFTGMATADEGVFKVADGMYGGYSYYWRGAATTNYVKFADFCWRIVRINGDGSIRLIYDGTTCHANGTSTTDSLIQPTMGITNYQYNASHNQSNYVGWTYEGTSQRPSSTTSGTASNAKTQTEKWFDANITGTNLSKVDTSAKYCNDRNTVKWAINGSTFYYAAYERTMTYRQPILSCPIEDTYTLKVGAIIADEVMYAGGWDANNTSYYLYNGQYYWTMSPAFWSSNDNAYMFNVSLYGRLGDDYVSYTSVGLRPVINLKANTIFVKGGNGTQSNPYVVL